MKFKKHANLMSHLLLAEKHHQLLLRNAESRPAREIHNTTALTGGPAGAGAIVPATGPGSGHQGRDFSTAGAGQRTEIEAHAAEAS
jgi:hypothetical protein